MHIRAFHPQDAAILPSILHEAVHQVGARAYSPAQVTAWSPAPMTAAAYLARIAGEHRVFVAVDEADHPIGFIELEDDGHIDCFYCHPDVIGTGVGAALYAALEAQALSVGIPRLYVEASETAKGFFTHKGFTLRARRGFLRNDVSIHNYAMEKDL